MTDRWTEETEKEKEGGKNGDRSWTEIPEDNNYAELSGLVIPDDQTRGIHSPFPGENVKKIYSLFY